MKKIFLLLIGFFLIAYNNITTNFDSTNMENITEIIGEDYYIISGIDMDITGNKEEETIYLVGYQDKTLKDDPIGSNYYDHIKLIIVDRYRGEFEVIALDYFKGLNPFLAARDFNGNGIADIFISSYTIPSGGAPKGLFNILTYKDKEVLFLLKNESMGGYGLDLAINLKDQHMVEINSQDLGIIYSFGLEQGIIEWLEEENIYHDGRVINHTNLSLGGFTSLEPVDTNKDGIYELIGSQYLSILSNSAGLGIVKSTLKYDSYNDDWTIIDLVFEPHY